MKEISQITTEERNEEWDEESKVSAIFLKLVVFIWKHHDILNEDWNLFETVDKNVWKKKNNRNLYFT